MAVTVFLDPTKMPGRTQDQPTFDANMAAYFANLPTFGQQINATAANMNSLAAGGAYAIPYTFSTGPIASTTGRISVDNSNSQGSSGHLYVNRSTAGASVDAILETFDDSTSAIKGQIRVVKAGDASKWLIFNLSSVVTYTNYRDCVAAVAAASETNPFADGDLVFLYFQRTGDKGDTGPSGYTPTYLYVRDEKANGSGGGVASNGATVRILNTVKVNTISGASLGTYGANAVTLPAGTYEYVGSVPGYQCNAFQAQLWNASDLLQVDVGTSEYSSASSAAQARSVVRGTFTITSSKAFHLRHLQVNGGAGTFGQAASNANGVAEVYSEIMFKKIA